MKFQKNIVSYFFLLISSCLLFYTFYKSEIYWNGEKRLYYYSYYILSLLLVFFSILTFFINRILKTYLMISVISIILVLYFFEGYLIIKEKKEQTLRNEIQVLKENLYEKKTGKKWDKRTRFKIYQDLKKTNSKISIAIRTNSNIEEDLELIPLSGVSNVKTIHCNENGYYSIYLSDRYGFNNPNQEWDKEEIEYVLIGDSHTHGNCVNRPNDIASVLRQISKKPVLNLGYRGTGSLIHLATLREYLKKNVKKVLWIYYENDLGDLNNELKSELLSKYIDDSNFSQKLLLKQNKINLDINQKIFNASNNIIINDSKFNFLKFVKLYNLRSLKLKKQNSSNLEEFEKIIKLAKNLTDKNNSKLYFIYLPSWESFNLRVNDKNYNSIKNLINELNIPFIDIYKEILKNEKNPLKFFPFEMYAHYNVEGYRKISEIIFNLTKN